LRGWREISSCQRRCKWAADEVLQQARQSRCQALLRWWHKLWRARHHLHSMLMVCMLHIVMRMCMTPVHLVTGVNMNATSIVAVASASGMEGKGPETPGCAQTPSPCNRAYARFITSTLFLRMAETCGGEEPQDGSFRPEAACDTLCTSSRKAAFSAPEAADSCMFFPCLERPNPEKEECFPLVATLLHWAHREGVDGMVSCHDRLAPVAREGCPCKAPP
jgi:hypothetical protein